MDFQLAGRLNITLSVLEQFVAHEATGVFGILSRNP